MAEQNLCQTSSSNTAHWVFALSGKCPCVFTLLLNFRICYILFISVYFKRNVLSVIFSCSIIIHPTRSLTSTTDIDMALIFLHSFYILNSGNNILFVHRLLFHIVKTASFVFVSWWVSVLPWTCLLVLTHGFYSAVQLHALP